MSGQYIAMDLDRCRELKHQFRATWSDKTPMKVSLQCVTCTLATGKSAYVAYGVDTSSWGQWIQRKREVDELS